MKNFQSKRTAFTLIELLVVIAMIAITTSSSIKVKLFTANLFSFV